MIEYFAHNLWLFWLIITFACLILELSSGDFYVTCFAIGGIVATCSAFIGFPFWLQVVIWTICSVLSIWLIRPHLLHLIHKGADTRESNADALIGKQGHVIEDIPADGYGYIQVDGDQWKSKSDNGQAIAKGHKVTIIARNSIKMTVKLTD